MASAIGFDEMREISDAFLIVICTIYQRVRICGPTLFEFFGGITTAPIAQTRNSSDGNGMKRLSLILLVASLAMLMSAWSGQPLTTREKGSSAAAYSVPVLGQ
jgi:hypothetical protein